MANLRKMEDTLDDLLAQEKVYWQQRSQIEWLKCGDDNTRFFHSYASSRKSNNTIKSLLNSDGMTVSDKQGLTHIISSFFEDLFSASGTNIDALNQVTRAIPTTVTADMNQLLLCPFVAIEVLVALQSMSPDKSPSSDGMSAMFYQHY